MAEQLFIEKDVLYYPRRYSGSRLKPNATSLFRRPTGEEIVYTNNRGWRVRNPGEVAGPCEVAVTGCSWAQGVAVNYDDSICGQLEKILGKKVANLSVGSFSLFQMVYHLRWELPVAKPKVVIVSYGHWQTSRCFLSNAFIDVCRRPVMMLNSKNRKKVEFRLPGVAPAWVVDRFARLEWLTDSPDTVLNRLLKKMYLCISRFFLFSFRNQARRFLGLGYQVSVNPEDEEEYLRMRRTAIEWSMRKFAELAAQHDCQIVVQHTYQYAQLDKKTWKYVEYDRSVFEDVVKNSSGNRIQYVGWEKMKRLVSDYMLQFEMTHEQAVEKIYYPGNNHPDEVGYRIIAESMAETLGKVIRD